MNRNIAAFVCLGLLAVFSGCSSSRPNGDDGALLAITPDLIRAHITYLASDSMMGRNTPSPQLDSASEYIARELKRLGAVPCNGSYFQKVPLEIVSLGSGNSLSLVLKGSEKSFELKTDFVPFEMTANRTVSAPVVFAGYGITAPEYKYDDYQGIDAHGKIVLVLRHEPGENDASSPFNGALPTTYSNVETKVRIARDHGAVGVLVVTDPLNHGLLTPRGFPWPSLSKNIPEDALPLTLGEDETKKLPVVHVGPAVIEALFGSIDSLTAIQKSMDAGAKTSAYVINAVANVRTSTSIKEMSARNVAGVIEGSDPSLRNEVLVLGAHYDHLGFKKFHAPGEDYIYNGADDNASGTAAVLTIAAAFHAGRQSPRRTVMFLFFAGEEKGLFGSRAYVDHPLLPLDHTIAMLNLDMVGRGPEDSLFIVGTSRSPDLVQLNEQENKSVGFKLVYGQEEFIGRSDQASFLKAHVPSIAFFTGEHPDYHQVSDEASRINYRKEARIVRLVFMDAWRIANESTQYQVIDKPISLF